eukprot:TRINITY_DN2506_c0_g1_i6.p1 TRINITY_DN2506_c0_g1~~TRINITY_DN2506_c0_g1_i6.p1  ORF type:complete len:722 (-),score=63.13 TRINITY_DN2506_c0_g1_i6:896-2998(-)
MTTGLQSQKRWQIPVQQQGLYQRDIKRISVVGVRWKIVKRRRIISGNTIFAILNKVCRECQEQQSFQNDRLAWVGEYVMNLYSYQDLLLVDQTSNFHARISQQALLSLAQEFRMYELLESLFKPGAIQAICLRRLIFLLVGAMFIGTNGIYLLCERMLGTGTWLPHSVLGELQKQNERQRSQIIKEKIRSKLFQEQMAILSKNFLIDVIHWFSTLVFGNFNKQNIENQDSQYMNRQVEEGFQTSRKQSAELKENTDDTPFEIREVEEKIEKEKNNLEEFLESQDESVIQENEIKTNEDSENKKHQQENISTGDYSTAVKQETFLDMDDIISIEDDQNDPLSNMDRDDIIFIDDDKNQPLSIMDSIAQQSSLVQDVLSFTEIKSLRVRFVESLIDLADERCRKSVVKQSSRLGIKNDHGSGSLKQEIRKLNFKQLEEFAIFLGLTYNKSCVVAFCVQFRTQGKKTQRSVLKYIQDFFEPKKRVRERLSFVVNLLDLADDRTRQNATSRSIGKQYARTFLKQKIGKLESKQLSRFAVNLAGRSTELTLAKFYRKFKLCNKSRKEMVKYVKDFFHSVKSQKVNYIKDDLNLEQRQPLDFVCSLIDLSDDTTWENTLKLTSRLGIEENHSRWFLKKEIRKFDSNQLKEFSIMLGSQCSEESAIDILAIWQQSNKYNYSPQENVVLFIEDYFRVLFSKDFFQQLQ